MGHGLRRDPQLSVTVCTRSQPGCSLWLVTRPPPSNWAPLGTHWLSVCMTSQESTPPTGQAPCGSPEELGMPLSATPAHRPSPVTCLLCLPLCCMKTSHTFLRKIRTIFITFVRNVTSPEMSNGCTALSSASETPRPSPSPDARTQITSRLSLSSAGAGERVRFPPSCWVLQRSSGTVSPFPSARAPSPHFSALSLQNLCWSSGRPLSSSRPPLLHLSFQPGSWGSLLCLLVRFNTYISTLVHFTVLFSLFDVLVL